MASTPPQFGQYPPAARVIVHLSDPHFLAGNRPLAGRYDTAENFARTLAAVERLAVRPDAIVITGDLTDLGEDEAYRDLRAAVEPVAERLGAPVAWVMGNHDERAPFRREMLGAPASAEPVTGVWDLGGLRLIALDTSVPGWHHGDLGEDQLAWLAAELETPAPLGTVLAMHHPPLPSHLPLFDVLELRDQHLLAAVVAGTDVRAILAGHLHYSTFGTFVGVPVAVSAASCYTMDVARPAASVNGVDAGQAFQLVHVYDDTITHTVVPVTGAESDESADVFTPEWVARMAALSAEERLEAFSRKRPSPGSQSPRG